MEQPVHTSSSLWWMWAILLAAGVAFFVSLAVWLGYATPSLARWQADWRAELREALGSVTSTPVVVPPPTTPIVPIEIGSGLPIDSIRLARRVSPVAQLLHKNVGETRTSMIGSAVSLTNDGWLATTFATLGSVRTGEYSVAVGGIVYPVERIVHDTSTGVVFLKIAAKDLTVAAFARSEDGTRGMSVYMEPAGRWLPTSIVSSLVFGDEAMGGSEAAMRRVLVSGNGADTWSGGAVWNGSGELAGLLERKTDEGYVIIPSRFVASGFTSLLTEGKIMRASLGVKTVELAGRVAGTVAGVTQGAWVHVEKGTAIVAQGPAVKKILDGDVIQSIDRDVLDGTVDLGERLFDYRPGSTVTVRGLRNGKPFQVDVKLSSLSTTEVIK